MYPGNLLIPCIPGRKPWNAMMELKMVDTFSEIELEGEVKLTS